MKKLLLFFTLIINFIIGSISLNCQNYIEYGEVVGPGSESYNKVAEEYYSKSYNYSLQEDYQEAIDWINMAISLSQNNLKYQFVRGSYYLIKKDFYLAFRDFDNVIKADPDYCPGNLPKGTVYVNRAKAKVFLNDIYAINDISTALRLNPNNEDAWLIGGLYYCTITKDKVQASIYAVRAKELGADADWLLEKIRKMP